MVGRDLKTNFEIPFVLVPGIFAPPITGSSPGAGSSYDVASCAAKRNAQGPAFLQLDVCWHRRPEHSKTDRGFRPVWALCAARCLFILAPRRGQFFARRNKPIHAKVAGTMCIH